MSVSIGQVKHLKGEQAKKFIKAFETSKINKDAALKVIETIQNKRLV